MKKNIFVLILFMMISFVMAEDIVLENGNVKFVFHEYSGSFSLYGKTEKNNKFISLIDNTNYSSNSGFYLNIDGISRKLERTYDIDVVINPFDYGTSVVYTVKNQAIVEIYFSTFLSKISTRADCVKVDIIVKNISEETHDYEVKAVFDTLLGEATRNHFYTAKLNPINTEMQLNNISEQKYVATSNGYDTIAFLLSGNSVTKPKTVFFASKDSILKNTWLPDIKNEMSFDSINTYNNSALAIIWDSMEIIPCYDDEITFYISTATNKKTFPLQKSFPTIMLNEEIEEVSLSFDVVSEDEFSENLKEKIDVEYIKDLLNRIHTLEVQTDGSNLDEIKKLNAELESIMRKVKEINLEINAAN